MRINLQTFFNVVIKLLYKIFDSSKDQVKEHPVLGNLQAHRFEHIFQNFLSKSLLGKMIKLLSTNMVGSLTQNSLENDETFLSSVQQVYISFKPASKDSDEKKIWSGVQMDERFNVLDQVLRYGKSTYTIHKSILFVTMTVSGFKSNFNDVVKMYTGVMRNQRQSALEVDMGLKEYFALVANEEVKEKNTNPKYAEVTPKVNGGMQAI